MGWTFVAARERCRKGNALPLLAIMFGFGLLSIALGQTNSWDLRNYHLYAGWAFWTGRGTLDFAAAQVQSYFNPILSTATYLLLSQTPPRAGAFVLGIVQSANIVPLYLVARRLLPPSSPGGNSKMAMFAAFAGAAGATQLAELGGTMGDNLVSLPTLSAFAIVFCARELTLRHIALAGLLIGCAVGLKLTVAPFAIGLMVVQPFLLPGGSVRWQALVVAGTAAAVGFLAVDGFWLLRLYHEFGNPLYPQLSLRFENEFTPPVSLRDTRFVPRSLFEWLFYPFAWLASPHRVSDAWFFDLRVPLAFAATPILLWRSGDCEDPSLVRALCAALIIAYVLWLPLFGIYRYLLPIEMLAPLVVVLTGQRSVAPRRGRAIASTLLIALIVLIRPPGWGRLRDYGDTFLKTEIPAATALGRATVVLADCTNHCHSWHSDFHRPSVSVRSAATCSGRRSTSIRWIARLSGASRTRKGRCTPCWRIHSQSKQLRHSPANT